MAIHRAPHLAGDADGRPLVRFARLILGFRLLLSALCFGPVAFGPIPAFPAIAVGHPDGLDGFQARSVPTGNQISFRAIAGGKDLSDLRQANGISGLRQLLAKLHREWCNLLQRCYALAVERMPQLTGTIRRLSKAFSYLCKLLNRIAKERFHPQAFLVLCNAFDLDGRGHQNFLTMVGLPATVSCNRRKQTGYETIISDMMEVQQERNLRRTILPNGLVLLTERMEHLRSVSMGVWVKTGSRDERPEVNGISHFIEHMVFKGTTTRTAQGIAREVDAIGGNLDAFTSKETICFNIKVLDDHLAKAVDVLCDLVLHPVFTPEDILRERGVILEEIKMDEDNPDTLVHETFVQNLWKNHPLGRPILGTKETVSQFDRPALLDSYGGRFLGGNVVVSAAGNLEHESFIAMMTEKLSALPAGRAEAVSGKIETYAPITLRKKKSLEQVQLCLGVPGLQINDDRRYTAFLMNTILGGGMSSRLFQTVREQRGLAYSIYSEPSSFRDTGSFCVYAGTSTKNAEQVIQLTVEEFQRLKNEPVTEEELRRAKDQLKGNLLLGLESSGSRMSNLARQEMYFERFFSIPEILERVEGVTGEAIQQLAQDVFQSDRIAVTLLGNLDGVKITRKHLAC